MLEMEGWIDEWMDVLDGRMDMIMDDGPMDHG